MDRAIFFMYFPRNGHSIISLLYFEHFFKIKLSGKKTPIVADKGKLRKNDIKNVVSDCSKIKKLGWKPKISINEGLELTLNWYITKKLEISKSK